jgi:hypothetical protein
LQASFNAVDRPARSTFIPGLLPAGQLAAGLALHRLTFQITLTTGPALAGLIAAAPHLGLRACYLTDTVSFAAALYGMARLPAMRPSGGTTLGRGLRRVRGRSPLERDHRSHPARRASAPARSAVAGGESTSPTSGSSCCT